jgi:hypothetical protein
METNFRKKGMPTLLTLFVRFDIEAEARNDLFMPFLNMNVGPRLERARIDARSTMYDKLPLLIPLQRLRCKSDRELLTGRIYFVTMAQTTFDQIVLRQLDRIVQNER